jgi:hypothetical protein
MDSELVHSLSQPSESSSWYYPFMYAYVCRAASSHVGVELKLRSIYSKVRGRVVYILPSYDAMFGASNFDPKMRYPYERPRFPQSSQANSGTAR